jgi:hypothetical protein
LMDSCSFQPFPSSHPPPSPILYPVPDRNTHNIPDAIKLNVFIACPTHPWSLVAALMPTSEILSARALSVFPSLSLPRARAHALSLALPLSRAPSLSCAVSLSLSLAHCSLPLSLNSSLLRHAPSAPTSPGSPRTTTLYGGTGAVDLQVSGKGDDENRTLKGDRREERGRNTRPRDKICVGHKGEQNERTVDFL